MVIAAHKPYEFPVDEMYLPVHVGSAGKATIPGTVRDDTGEQISALNPTYCELTGLYWLWKNSEPSDVYGLSHYRRFFAGTLAHPGGKRVLGSADVAQAMAGVDIIVGRRRWYGVETIRSHYANAHHAKDLDLTREVIEQSYPDYLEAFDTVMSRRSLSLYNMALMRADVFEDYCTWLFTILDQVHARIDMTGYSDADKRVVGYLAERLLNVYVLKHSAEHVVRRRRVVQIEGEPVVAKAVGLLRRKLRRSR